MFPNRNSRSVGRALAIVAGALVAILGIAFATLMIGMRRQIGPVSDAVRRFNRAVTNPQLARTAGAISSRTSLICHVGRRSGRSYRTPVDVVPTDSGFLIALPYGTKADWLRNVLAAGVATVVTGGQSVDVGSATIVTTDDVADLLPRGQLRTLRLFGVTRCVSLRRAG
jgi:deazaflavin-dependent oxidoreductase (nitroreductase family)